MKPISDLEAARATSEALAERLTTLYSAELRHGPGGFSIEIDERTDDEGVIDEPTAQPLADAVGLALRRLFGMAHHPRFSRDDEGKLVEPEPEYAAELAHSLERLAGAGACAVVVDDRGASLRNQHICDDGFVLLVRRADRTKSWAVTVCQAHD
jgi:hypothetical protein